MLTSAAPRQRCEGDGGAVIVEFALVLPLLLLLVFGIIELGWTFGQYLDVRHGARESARLAAVNYQVGTTSGDDQSAAIVAETCGRLANPDVSSVRIDLDDGRVVGGAVRVTVTQSVDGLTGFLDPFLPSDLTSEAVSRLERPATYNATATYTAACPT